MMPFRRFALIFLCIISLTLFNSCNSKFSRAESCQNSSLSPNSLTKEEINDGWELLFDGKSLNGWRNYRKNTIGRDWIVEDQAIHLHAQSNAEGHWQAQDGGDIITDREFENFILKLQWKISKCGNNGIMFNVVESEKYDYVWQTGPEMQVLDNSCHPDAQYKTHRAGDLFDLISCTTESVKQAGEWNDVVIQSIKGKLDFWLNGVHVVSTQMFNKDWEDMIAKSKFKDMPDFGKSRKGHISIQDHGDKVWYRNIKIKNIKS